MSVNTGYPHFRSDKIRADCKQDMISTHSEPSLSANIQFPWIDVLERGIIVYRVFFSESLETSWIEASVITKRWKGFYKE